MPVYLRPNELYVKNPNGSGYLPQNVISETSTAEMLAAFDETITNTQQSLGTIVSTAQTAIEGIESQKNTMIASIATVAGQGTDTTLTQSGVAADANAAGELKKAYVNTNDAILNPITITDLITFEQGRYSYSTGSTAGANSVIRPKKFIPENVVRISCSSSYKFVIWAWSALDDTFIGHRITDGTYVKTSQYDYETDHVFDWNVGYKYKITFYASDNSNIDPSVASNCIAWFATDETFSVSGKAADAGVVGTSCLHFLKVTKTDATNTYSGHAANLPVNTYCWVEPSWFDDVPTDVGTCWLYTIFNSTGLYGYQKAFNPTSGYTFIRQKRSSQDVYNSWVLYSRPEKTFVIKNVPSGTTSFDGITENGIYFISDGDGLLNKPPFIKGGWLHVYSYITPNRLNLTQIFVAWGGSSTSIYTRTKGTSDSNWTAWVSRTEGLAGTLSNNTDLDDVIWQSTYALPSTSTYTNSPSSDVRLLITQLYNVEGDWALQTAMTLDRKYIYYRHRNNGIWQNWVQVPTYMNSLAYKSVIATNTDLDDISTIGIYGLNSDASYSNKPDGLTSGYLVVFEYSANFKTQIAFKLNGTIYASRYYGSGSWKSWNYNRPIENYHDTTAKYFAFGDSTTKGQIGGASGTSTHNYPECIGKVLNMDVKNKAVGGQGLISDWDYIHTNYIENLDMTGAKLITVGWAYNDSSNYSSMAFGASTDTGDTTFIGKYFTIMKEFQQKCPTAKVILITGYGYAGGSLGPPVVIATLTQQFTHQYTFADGAHTVKEMYDTLEEMCHLHGWGCVNQAKGCAFNQWNASSMIGDQIHPTDAGYLHYGNTIAAKVAAEYANIATW